MKIVVDDIPEGGLSLDLSIEGDKIKGKDAGGLDFDFLGRVKAHLDTTEIIIAQLALEAPMKPLCSIDCKGLCPVCGADRNQGPCGHENADKTDPRLAVLKGFKPGGRDGGPKDA